MKVNITEKDIRESSKIVSTSSVVVPGERPLTYHGLMKHYHATKEMMPGRAYRLILVSSALKHQILNNPEIIEAAKFSHYKDRRIMPNRLNGLDLVAFDLLDKEGIPFYSYLEAQRFMTFAMMKSKLGYSLDDIITTYNDLNKNQLSDIDLD